MRGKVEAFWRVAGCPSQISTSAIAIRSGFGFKACEGIFLIGWQRFLIFYLGLQQPLSMSQSADSSEAGSAWRSGDAECLVGLPLGHDQDVRE